MLLLTQISEDFKIEIEKMENFRQNSCSSVSYISVKKCLTSSKLYISCQDI